jgi:mRNA interferase HigB
MGKRKPPDPQPGEVQQPKKNHLISRKKFREFVKTHRAGAADLAVFYRWAKTTEQALWRKFADVRATFGTADRVGDLTVFNVGGNKYRVVALIDYARARVYIRHVLTHEEYDREVWKEGS